MTVTNSSEPTPRLNSPPQYRRRKKSEKCKLVVELFPFQYRRQKKARVRMGVQYRNDPNSVRSKKAQRATNANLAKCNARLR